MVIKYIILALYFLVLFLIGILSTKKISNIKDYYVGGKKLGYWVVAFSTRATGESAWLLLGLTGLGAIAGVSAFWVVLGETIGVLVAWFLMAKPFKKLSDQYDSITIPDYLVSHFKAKTNTLRIIASMALSVFVVIYVSAQIDATGSAFEAFLDMNYYTGALVGFAIVVFYILFGGFVAVAWSDLFQGLLMFMGLAMIPIVGLFSLDQGPVLERLSSIDPGLTNIWGAGGFTTMNLATILGFMLIGLGYMGSPQIFVRFMSIKNENEINKGRWVALGYTLLSDVAAVMVGLFGRYLFTDAGIDPEAVLGNNGQDVLIQMVENIMPLTIVGLYVAIVLSAIMSTIDSLLVVASSAVVRDFYQQIFRPETKNDNLTRLSRIVTVSMALVALALALTVAITTPERTIFWFVIFGWSGIAATFCPVIILSLFWKNYTERGAIASMVVGFLSVPFFKFVMTVPVVGLYFVEVAKLGPSFALSMLAGWVFSVVGKKEVSLTN
ncbi:MAG: sodium/proline symporter [Saprospiraceae bacterium]